MRTYAAELNEQNQVIRVIVGDADWATQHLGGRWVTSPKAGPGWLYIENQVVPPQPYPSWILVNGQWQPPVPMPEGEWAWDENSQSWISIPPPTPPEP